MCSLAVVNSNQQAETAQAFSVGDVLENFGAIVQVIAPLDAERGQLVRIIPAVRNGVKQGGVGQRYFANPAKCVRIRGNTAAA